MTDLEQQKEIEKEFLNKYFVGISTRDKRIFRIVGIEIIGKLGDSYDLSIRSLPINPKDTGSYDLLCSYSKVRNHLYITDTPEEAELYQLLNLRGDR